MEAAISATVGDLITRVISFVVKKYTDETGIDENLERLQQLLLRIHAVVEEADGRYITNSMMLAQLKFLVESMYHGYHVLDTFKQKSLLDKFKNEGVSFSAMSISSHFIKRSRTLDGRHTKPSSAAGYYDLGSVLKNLEASVANMNEFVVLLGGYDRMCRRPYDNYLYTDNFMFGRHVEKQHAINILLHNGDPGATPMVLPIIGGCRVGKKVFVSHVCDDERVRSHFSSILYINGNSISSFDLTIFSKKGRTLVVVEFAFNIDNEEWTKFYSSATQMSIGSKLIIISRHAMLARFGTVKAICLNSLSQAEYSYLFKMLAFGSTQQKEHPQHVSVANEIAIVLGGSLITANVVADLLRRNLSVQFWLHILERFKGMVENNVSRYGEHPKDIIEKERPVDITRFVSRHPSSLCLMPPRVEKDECSERELHTVMFGELIAGSASIPDKEFELVAWKSRIPPYTKYVHSVVFYDDKKHASTAPTRKRQSRIFDNFQ